MADPASTRPPCPPRLAGTPSRATLRTGRPWGPRRSRWLGRRRCPRSRGSRTAARTPASGRKPRRRSPAAAASRRRADLTASGLFPANVFGLAAGKLARRKASRSAIWSTDTSFSSPSGMTDLPEPVSDSRSARRMVCSLPVGADERDARRRLGRQEPDPRAAVGGAGGVGQVAGLHRPVRVEDVDQQVVGRLVGERRQVRPEALAEVPDLVAGGASLGEHLLATVAVAGLREGRAVGRDHLGAVGVDPAGQQLVRPFADGRRPVGQQSLPGGGVHLGREHLLLSTRVEDGRHPRLAAEQGRQHRRPDRRAVALPRLEQDGRRIRAVRPGQGGDGRGLHVARRLRAEQFDQERPARHGSPGPRPRTRIAASRSASGGLRVGRHLAGPGRTPRRAWRRPPSAPARPSSPGRRATFAAARGRRAGGQQVELPGREGPLLRTADGSRAACPRSRSSVLATA